MIRVAVLLGVTGAGLYLVDSANVAVFQSLGIGMFLVGGTHVTRRILFHKIDMQKVALEAVSERNLPAALVFLGMCGVIVAIMFLSIKAIS